MMSNASLINAAKVSKNLQNGKEDMHMKLVQIDVTKVINTSYQKEDKKHSRWFPKFTLDLSCWIKIAQFTFWICILYSTYQS